MVGIVEGLQKKVEVMDERNLEAMERKLQALTLDLENVARLNEKNGNNPQEDKKVNISLSLSLSLSLFSCTHSLLIAHALLSPSLSHTHNHSHSNTHTHTQTHTIR